jgi:cobalt/nickel transport system permease protein
MECCVHIPDGYLSPASCAIAYALAIPAWGIALRRVRSILHTRMVPMLAVVSAFCFVVMMFNLPLPGGTSGHAVGMTIAAIILGPSAGMIAVSMALLIQAMFFGDGGVSTLGANCLNMAIAGTLVAYGIYRLIAGRSAATSRRRVIAAGLAGYLAINVSALLAAIEFGLQPMFFHDSAGTALYAPYPLSIAVPAMMIGHLGIAGLAELFVSAGLVAYLQRANPVLLEVPVNGGRLPVVRRTGWQMRSLLYVLAVAMMLSPLGLLAGGSAWGEWTAADFSDHLMRQAIGHASSGVAPPALAPVGLVHLSSLWHAPMVAYMPSFVSNPILGYLCSAFFGVGLILLMTLLVHRVRTVKSMSRDR